MVTRVAAPAEHYLITQGSSLVSQFGIETLCKFSLQKLLEHRLTNRNLKAGLDFTDSYKATKASERLMKMILGYVKKEFAFLYKGSVTDHPFLQEVYMVGNRLELVTYYDKSVIRYCRLIQRALTRHSIPVTLNVVGEEYNTTDRLTITIDAANRYAVTTIHLYKILFFMDDVLKFFKVLTRKATFTDQDAKTLTRSRCSGYIAPADSQRDGVNESQPAPTPSRTRNNRATG